MRSFWLHLDLVSFECAICCWLVVSGWQQGVLTWTRDYATSVQGQMRWQYIPISRKFVHCTYYFCQAGPAQIRKPAPWFIISKKRSWLVTTYNKYCGSGTHHDPRCGTNTYFSNNERIWLASMHGAWLFSPYIQILDTWNSGPWWKEMPCRAIFSVHVMQNNILPDSWLFYALLREFRKFY